MRTKQKKVLIDLFNSGQFVTKAIFAKALKSAKVKPSKDINYLSKRVHDLRINGVIIETKGGIYKLKGKQIK